MGTKRSLIEVVHDEGYGNALLMHINHAFGSRDMRAERVIDLDCRECRYEQIRDAAIDLLWYFYGADDRPTETWAPAEALRQAVGVSVEELRKQA